jgi:hypothetical protein
MLISPTAKKTVQQALLSINDESASWSKLDVDEQPRLALRATHLSLIQARYSTFFDSTA